MRQVDGTGRPEGSSFGYVAGIRYKHAQALHAVQEHVGHCNAIIMASVLVPVLYIGIVISSLFIFSHFYRKRNAGKCPSRRHTVLALTPIN